MYKDQINVAEIFLAVMRQTQTALIKYTTLNNIVMPSGNISLFLQGAEKLSLHGLLTVSILIFQYLKRYLGGLG